MYIKDDTPEGSSRTIAIVEQPPSLSESLHREGHWCQSTTCPRRREAGEDATGTEQQSAAATPVIKMGEWCESTACPLV